MSKTPKYKPNMTEPELRKLLATHFPNAPTHEGVMLVGIRGFFAKEFGNPKTNDRGVYDDALFVLSKRGYFVFNWNMDPNGFGYNARAGKGFANLKCNRIHRWKKGMHKSSYWAFVQAEPFTVVRDAYTRNGRHYPSITETGMFGIHGHEGGDTGTSSEGCHTAPKPQWPELKTIVYALMTFFKQGTIAYLPIDLSEL